jgi:hypothetical protein
MRELCRFSFGLLWLAVALLLVGCGPSGLPTSPAEVSPAANTSTMATSPVEGGTGTTTIAPSVGSQNALSDATPGLLAGAITGLDPGGSISLRLEFLEPTGLRPELSEPLARRTLEPGEVVQRFPVVNAPGRRPLLSWSRGGTA